MRNGVKSTKVGGQYLCHLGQPIIDPRPASNGAPMFQLYTLDNGAAAYSLKEFASYLDVKNMGREAAAAGLLDTEIVSSSSLMVTKDGLRCLCGRSKAISHQLLALFMGVPRDSQSDLDVRFARLLISELGGLKISNQPGYNANFDFSRYTDLLPVYVNTLNRSRKGSRDLVLLILQCFQQGCGSMELLWYEMMCTTVHSKFIDSGNGLRYSEVEWRFWILFFSIASAGVLRLLRGGAFKNGTGSARNTATIMIPNPRDIQRKVNTRPQGNEVDFEPVVAIAEESQKKYPHSFLCISGDGIHAGETLLVPEYDRGNNRLIGVVDFYEGKSVKQLELELFKVRQDALNHIVRLKARRVDVYHPLFDDNPKNDLNQVIEWLKAKKKLLEDTILPSLQHSCTEEAKATSAKQRQVDSAKDNVNPNMKKALDNRIFKYNTIKNLFARGKQVCARLLVLLRILDENVLEIACRGIQTSHVPFYVSDLVLWKDSWFSQHEWRESLIDLINATSLFEIDWKVFNIPTANQLFAVVVSDSMGGKYVTVAAESVSQTGDKATTYGLLWKLCVQLYQERGLLVRTIVTDGEFMSRIGEPIPGQGFTLFRSLYKASEKTVELVTVGKSGTAKYFEHLVAIASLRKEYLCSRKLVEQLPAPDVDADVILWMRRAQLFSMVGSVKFHPQAAKQFLAYLLNSADLLSDWEQYAHMLSPTLFYAADKMPNPTPEIDTLVQIHKETFKMLMNDTLEFLQLKRQNTSVNFGGVPVLGDDQKFFSVVQLIVLSVRSQSRYISSGPMAAVLRRVHLHMRLSIDLAKNREKVLSSTSLNVDIYRAFAHPLNPSKAMFWTPDYDHLIPKNLVKGVVASNFLDIRSTLEMVLDNKWFARDDQNVRMGCEAFSERTLDASVFRANVQGRDFMRVVANMYRAVDESGHTDQERIGWAKELERTILRNWGEQLSNLNTCSNSKFDGLSWQVVIGLLILARNFICLTEELIAELQGNDCNHVLFVGRATFCSNYVEQ
ncbi:hypothetical protein HDU99_009734, partial [Rhizoclosmatium hyalinum]